MTMIIEEIITKEKEAQAAVHPVIIKVILMMIIDQKRNVLLD